MTEQELRRHIETMIQSWLEKQNHTAKAYINLIGVPEAIESFAREIRNEALEECIVEVQGWRALMIKYHESCPTTNPEETLREHKNTLNLLGVIEAKFRKAKGEDGKTIFRALKVPHDQ